jgi:hypothetical protein
MGVNPPKDVLDKYLDKYTEIQRSLPFAIKSLIEQYKDKMYAGLEAGIRNELVTK